MKEKYFLQVKANGLGIKVYLNGVPLVEEPEGFGIQETIPVNYWLMHKENSLHVQLTHPEVVSEENQIEEAHNLGIRIYLFGVYSKGDNLDAIEKHPDFILSDKVKHLVKVLK